VQIDPILPVNVTFTLDYPDGRAVTTSGTGDSTGSFSGAKWALDIPGIYRFFLTGDWQGNKALMPGLPPDGGVLYVIHLRSGPGLRSSRRQYRAHGVLRCGNAWSRSR